MIAPSESVERGGRWGGLGELDQSDLSAGKQGPEEDRGMRLPGKEEGERIHG
jgi:hypothetical protein